MVCEGDAAQLVRLGGKPLPAEPSYWHHYYKLILKWTVYYSVLFGEHNLWDYKAKVVVTFLGRLLKVQTLARSNQMC